MVPLRKQPNINILTLIILSMNLIILKAFIHLQPINRTNTKLMQTSHILIKHSAFLKPDIVILHLI